MCDRDYTVIGNNEVEIICPLDLERRRKKPEELTREEQIQEIIDNLGCQG